MSWASKTDSILKSAMATFGQAVSYVPVSTGVAVEITGVFGRESVEVNLGRGAPVSTNHPTLGIILADLAVRPAKGDTAEISGTTYRVIDCQEDGEGGASLRLQKNV